MMLAMLPAMSRGHRRPRVTIAPPAAPNIISVDFEDGTLGALAGDGGVNVTVINDPTGGRGGKVARIRYNDASGNDTNRYASYQRSVGQEFTAGSLWSRAYIYTPSPFQVFSARKLFYFFPRDGSNKVTSGVVLIGTDIRWFGGNTATNGAQLELSTGVAWPVDQYNCLEKRIDLGTPGSAGSSRVYLYLNGSQIWANNPSTQPLTLLSDVGDNIGFFEFGSQMHFLASPQAYDEWRYFDNVAVSTAGYIGA